MSSASLSPAAGPGAGPVTDRVDGIVTQKVISVSAEIRSISKTRVTRRTEDRCNRGRASKNGIPVAGKGGASGGSCIRGGSGRRRFIQGDRGEACSDLLCKSRSPKPRRVEPTAETKDMRIDKCIGPKMHQIAIEKIGNGRIPIKWGQAISPWPMLFGSDSERTSNFLADDDRPVLA